MALPSFYGQEALTALPQDPRRVWLHWELSPKRLDELRESIERGARAEVILLTASSRRPVAESPCDLAAARARLKAPPGQTCYAELGFKRAGRPFTVLLRSAPFTMPNGEGVAPRRRKGLDLPADLEHFTPPRDARPAGPTGGTAGSRKGPPPQPESP